MTKEVPQPVEPPTPEEEALMAQLPESQLRRVDDALLASAHRHWRKVAMVVSTTMLSVENPDERLPVEFFVRRLRKLVGEGRLESQGNLDHIRFSEVRLPVGQASSAEPPKPRRSFRDKLSAGTDLPRVQPLEGGMKERYGEGTIVLPAPGEVDTLMRQVPAGRVTTINHLREHLARRHGATVACPIVTGVCARIAAGAAGEDEAEGKQDVTPYWRTLKSDGEVNAKYPGGLPGQRQRLEAEGLQVVARRKRLYVRNHERLLARLP